MRECAVAECIMITRWDDGDRKLYLEIGKKELYNNYVKIAESVGLSNRFGLYRNTRYDY